MSKGIDNAVKSLKNAQELYVKASLQKSANSIGLFLQLIPVDEIFDDALNSKSLSELSRKISVIDSILENIAKGDTVKDVRKHKLKKS